MSHPNEAVVRGFLEAAIGVGIDAARPFLAEDVTWHFAGRSPIAGTYRGPDGVAEFSAAIDRLMGDSQRLTFHDLLANDDHVVVLWTRTAERPGRRLETHGAGVYHVRDGTIREVWVFHEDLYAFDEFASA